MAIGWLPHGELERRVKALEERLEAVEKQPQSSHADKPHVIEETVVVGNFNLLGESLAIAVSSPMENHIGVSACISGLKRRDAIAKRYRLTLTPLDDGEA